ncbi:MAG: hypothetical protein NZ483_11725, partial [Verrucomicrobiae bacterium]|nr:hypothetical protein [Verrucomicrobiae bacterium]
MNSHFYTAINGASAATIVHSGGTIEVGGNYQPSWQGNSTITQSGGQLLVTGQFRMGENGNTTYNLSGGQIFVSGANSYIGLFNGSKTSTMNQSGGTATFQTLQIGINQTANYNLTGGQLNALQLDKVSSGSLNLSGGTLTAGTITFNVVNNGSTISPGTNNFTGRTTINGTFVTSSGTLALKIGGTTAATAYQDTVSKYANVTATGAITLGGNLKPTLINSFTPGASDTFTIVSGSSVSGTFGNTATANGGGVRVVLADGLSSFKVNYNPTTVVLANYMGDNEWQGSSGANWGAAGAASWTALDPNGSAYIAKFADAPGG